MTYLKMVVHGAQTSSESTKEGFYLYETLRATEGQTLTVIKGEYRPNEYELEVHINGVRQIYEEDYLELDKHTIEFLEPLEDGDKLLFTVRKGKSNTILHEKQLAKKDQSVITLSGTYHPGRSTLLVFDNGQLLTLGDDYLETDERTVTFTEPFDGAVHRLIFHEVV